jgi:hypothetical protein
MPKARKTQASIEAAPYYHCISRSIRRAFLCGKDSQSGQNYEHRRQWIEDRLLSLSNIFATDIAAYTIMNNHYHVVLSIKTLKNSFKHQSCIQVAGSFCSLKPTEGKHPLRLNKNLFLT